MHHDGEIDTRSAYCATSVASLCGLPLHPLFDGTQEWIASAQTYEGGIAAVPGCEAHGGYAFCGLAAYTLLGGAAGGPMDINALAVRVLGFACVLFVSCLCLSLCSLVYVLCVLLFDACQHVADICM